MYPYALINYLYRTGFFSRTTIRNTPHNMKIWLTYNIPEILNHPPQSSDLNSSGHLWEHLGRKISESLILENKNTSKQVLQEDIGKISG